MDRRSLLRGLMVGIPVTGAAVAGAALKTTRYVQETSGQSMETCKRQIRELRERMDRSEASTRKTIRAVLALTALSLGLDVSTLL